MTKVAYGKSQKRLDTDCSILNKKFSPKENRAKGKYGLMMMKSWTFWHVYPVPNVRI
jgi:hypothetical protein